MDRLKMVGLACLVTLIGTVPAQEPAPPASAASAQAGPAPELKTLWDKVSYIIGRNLGTNLRDDQIEVNLEVLFAAVREAYAGQPSRLEPDIVEATMEEFQDVMIQKRQQKAAAEAARNKTEGEAFLTRNKAKQGVVTLASGLQYEVLSEGKGPKPSAADVVTVHYHGTLIDGTVFDSSINRGEPATFPVRGVIPGWTEALQLMPVGSAWRLVIPPALAYGSEGAGGVIGPNATLIFEVRLISIAER